MQEPETPQSRISPVRRIGLLAAGGPAPGINSVIGAATIRACLSGVEVLGLVEGYRWLAQGDTSRVTKLTINDVSRIHFRGGSHIGISRASPMDTEEHLENTLSSLRKLQLDGVITIGGDGTALTATRLAEAAGGSLQFVHVPKTIDNDIDLPFGNSTFGYQTARHVGVEIVKNLMVDAKTTARWYFVVAMGRKAGHLALGIGKAAGATLTLIPEEFPNPTPIDTIADVLVGAILKRIAYGRDDGVAMIAEGLVDRIPVAELARYTKVERDGAGQLHLSAINVGEVLRDAVAERLSAFNLEPVVVPKTIGYEVRCADPIPFDMEYARDLGYCAARYMLEGGTDAMVSIQHGRFRPIPFSQLVDPATGKTRVRMVDIESDRYKIARSYMLRLRKEDFDSEPMLSKLAKVAGVTPEAFRARFSPLVENEPSAVDVAGSYPPPPDVSVG